MKGIIKYKSIVIISVVSVVLIGLHTTLFWGGSGTVIDLIQGNLSPAVDLSAFTTKDTRQSQNEITSVLVSIETVKPIFKVLPEYLSFTLDTSQVVGGKWWNLKADKVETGSGTKHAPVFDFNKKKLDSLVSALTPAYLRIGGSEADKVFYDLESREEYVDSQEVPERYHQTMTARQWDNLNSFVKRNGLKFAFTLNSGPSARNKSKEWDPRNAEELMRYSKEKGYTIDVFELGNEHNLFWYIYGLGQIVDPDQYQKDILVLRQLMEQYYPQARLGSQGSAIWPVLGELLGAFFGFYKEMIELSGGDVDVIAWHYYPQQSRRGPFASRKAHPARLLDSENLDEAAYWAKRFTGLRDQFAEGKGIWLGETGNAQFGGEPGVSDAYIGGLWWLDQLGLLAANGVEAVFRQTLAGMNYGMMDPETLDLNPDYWNSLLWKQLMGTDVYKVNLKGENTSKVRVYAHSRRDEKGLTVLAINLDHQKKASFTFSDVEQQEVTLFRLTTPDILGKDVHLNGRKLNVDDAQTFPEPKGKTERYSESNPIVLGPLTYGFVQFKGQ
ncbi:glycoside hydrolase [bacterium]|nr:glycoside hydrolase [bacterium]